MHALDRRTDGRTDRQTEFSSLDRVCMLCSAVKMELSVPIITVQDDKCKLNAHSMDLAVFILFLDKHAQIRRYYS